MSGVTRRLVSAMATLLWAAGCASLVGIEDFTRDARPPDSKECIEYCDTVATACVGAHELYTRKETCLGTCRLFPLGDRDEPRDNTVACRLTEAKRAISTEEPGAHCPSAGPVGAPNCGKACESWCMLMKETCPVQYGIMSDCVKSCSAFKDRQAWDIKIDHDGDTVQCRIQHVSNATGSETAPAEHCPHAAHISTNYCRADQKAAPDCTEFCRFNREGCSGEFAVYESTAQCMAVCNALEPGTYGDRTQNTMGCRHYHTFNSLIDPGSHCPHTGPGGDGHCGVDETGKHANCVSYCALAEKACSAAFSAKYASQTACQLECSTQPMEFGSKIDSKYTVAMAQSGNTLQCRLLHAARALTDERACPSALGQGACQ